MSFLPIYRTLKADVELAKLIDVETKLFEDMAPFKLRSDGTVVVTVSPPYMVWTTISGQANNHLDCPANFDDTQYQLMVYATNARDAYAIRDAARAVLETKSWILNPSINHFETETKLYARGFDGNWILER